MAVKKNTYKKASKEKEKEKTKVQLPASPKLNFNSNLLSDKRFRITGGLVALFFALFLFLSIFSYLFTGKADQSVVEAMGFGSLITSGLEVENWLGLTGAGLAHLFVYQWFGVAALLLVPFIFSVGYQAVFAKTSWQISRIFSFCFFFMFWFSVLLGYLVLVSKAEPSWGFLCGGIGYYLAFILNSFVGWGTPLFLIVSLAIFITFFYKASTLQLLKNKVSAQLQGKANQKKPEPSSEDENKEIAPATDTEEAVEADAEWQITAMPESEKESPRQQALQLTIDHKTGQQQTDFATESTEEAMSPAEVVPHVPVEDANLFDPRLELGSYQFPTLELLNESNQGKVKVTKEELEENKDKIIQTLSHFKIGITSIKATIGPTVTLYEIVPDAGIKISRIRNLEDDIALSLAAMGIRIIAPIPGRGTIGIEVPNKNREMVSIRSLLSTEEFIKNNRELPVVLGKTISNEVFVTDLTKMPHLLMAGATGQGKSVGLNVILTSLIYKKHPAELKLVLIDPKKVELSLFNQLERHFLASMPDAEEPIITDTTKAIHVLNSLCIEMDERYNLLKDAGCRNIKEYNQKFKHRRLNPEKGHRYLPYIVLVIDELADLMMTAGKEVEMPIARLAQLARAIGIHLIIATQRPSVDVITGIIKANFPARLSFKVTAKVDSRTILDTSGADQLIGMGDMLLSNGSEIIRLQCAFVDTEEVENLCNFVGSQRGYDTSYMLPEYQGEETSRSAADLAEKDALFEEAARLLVIHQQGSTSLIQRKLSLGYNRAGRIIDQLEAAGIVGPFEGSKARQVLIQDEYALEQVLRGLH